MLTITVTKENGSMINDGCIGYFSDNVGLQLVPFTGNSCEIDLPHGKPYYIYAIEQNNYEFLKTYYGATPLWCGLIDGGETIFNHALPVYSTDSQITIELLSCISETGNSIISYTIELDFAGNPIKDVDVTLKKIPPKTAIINNGDHGNNLHGQYLNLIDGLCYLVLDIPHYKYLVNPKFTLNNCADVTIKTDTSQLSINTIITNCNPPIQESV